MKIAVTAARILTGLLFIFSGLVKAIDPKGLAYKMQEFFEAWSNSGFMPGLMKSFDHYALSFSVIMITLEVAVGVALLIGWQKKLTAVILLLLMLFFTFLTAYVLFTGKIRACGCFGDCLPLTPVQTFTKDIILLVLSLFILLNVKYIRPVAKPLFSTLYMIAATAAVLFLQWYVLRNLPVVDCLPYKPGNHILDLRKMPANAVADKFDYVFVYEKDGIKKEFKADAIPDSTWTFSDRKQTLVQKGSNNIPVINDFSLTTESGNDSTEAILNTPGEYYLLYIRDLENYPKNWRGDFELLARLAQKGSKLFIVTSQLNNVKQRFTAAQAEQGSAGLPQFLTCDATVLKTVARVNPTLYIMNGPVVKSKRSWTEFKNIP
ncbi:MAG: BT_3928 family protein [Ferruginibacter sp.]